MSAADNGEDEAVLDVKVPTRRRRASDDEADEAEFHDAAEYAASVADSQAVDREEQGAEEPQSEGTNEDGSVSRADSADEEQGTGAEEQPGENEETDQLAGDRKKAKLREPFEVPTSGAFWLHDDRFGGEEAEAEPPRPSGAAERKARSDTEGRWLHDKFSALELGEDTGDDNSENAFPRYRRGSGRGMRGGRRGGGRALAAGGRGQGPAEGRGRGRSGRYATSSVEHSSEPGEFVPAPTAPSVDTQEALPQRQPRALRAAARAAAAPASSHSEDVGAGPRVYPGPGRGRGQGARGGRGGESSGRGGSRERSFSPETSGRRESGYAPEAGNRGRGRGPPGRGRGLEDGDRAGDPSGRGGYGRGAGRGYGRGPDASKGGAIGSGNSGVMYDRGRGRGRGAGRSTGDFQGREPAYSRGPAGAERGLPLAQRPQQATAAATQVQHQRRSERSLDEDFPPLPCSTPAKRPALSLDMPPGVSSAATVHSAADAAAPATQGVRRYSKMAGKVAGGGAAAVESGAGICGGAAGAAGATATGVENGRARGAGGDGSTAARASKLSAAAPTFEPSPAVAAGRQPAAQAPPAPPAPQQQLVPSVPMAFGAPLQPMTVIATGSPPQPIGAVPEQYGAGGPLQHGQTMPYMPQQQHAPQQQQPQPIPNTYGAPLQPLPSPQQQQQPAGPGLQPPRGTPMVPQQQQQGGGGGGTPYAFMGAMMYGASPTEVEAWYQDAYQKALATGMDPQQAYSAVQGYVQGLSMAYAVVEQQRQQQQQQQQVLSSYPVGGPSPPQMSQAASPTGP